jgi:hypothetical protein
MEKKMKEYSNHINGYEDLKTTYNEIRAGFISIALEKNKRATPYVEEAKVLRNRIKNVPNPNGLIGIQNIRNGLITAAGISDKAAKHLGIDGCNDAIQELIKNFLLPAGDNFRDELVFRFLLTKGDSLGGSMRNIVGALAKRKLNRTIVAALRLSDKEFHWFDKKQWRESKEIDFEDLYDAKGLYWENDKGMPRYLYYDITVPLIRNNIDVILLNEQKNSDLKSAILVPENFIALGELKGGIDPAGADEHWKTAKTAIDRIVNGFANANLNPKIFYIGAAIENKMASEIFDNLEQGYINNAANLTKDEHMASITEWIVGL